MVKAVVAGAAGKMGQRVIQAIYQTEGIELVGAWECRDHPSLNEDAGIVAGIPQLDVPILADVKSSLQEHHEYIDVLTRSTNSRKNI
jgi:4-hydroxy-tetrahydrodipicolinate reductase